MKQYYYRPLKANPSILKCAGHGAEDQKHLAFYLPYFDKAEEPGCIHVAGTQILGGYRGNLIDATTHKEVSWESVNNH